MKKNYFRMICALLALCLLFSGCTVVGNGEESQPDTGEVTGKEHILKAWSGEFSEEKLKETIEKYRNGYQPIGDTDAVTIETDFDISSYIVSRISKVDDSDIEVEMNGYIDLIIDTERDGRKITVNTDWWHIDGEITKKYTVWSYLVLVRDTEGGEHYYYFRMNYSSAPAKPRETAEVTGYDYNPMQGAAIEYLTAREFNPNRTAGKVSKNFREAYADFALKLLCESRSSFEGDALLVSPLSAMLALAMTANGAEGKTLEEMENVLGGGMYIEDLNGQLFNYTSALVSTNDAKFNLANAVWVTSDPSFSINRNFVKAVENTFDADIVAADLPKSIDAINNWASEETFGMIKEILNKESFNPDTVMILLNALALDALWQAQTDDYACFEDIFKGVDKNVQKTTFMWTECNGYIKGRSETGIVKNYRGGNYAFLALLPDENISIYDYATSLDGETFLELYDKRKEARYNAVEIDAKMPHFKFECTIDLIPVLKKMGMMSAFSGSTADFDGLGTSSKGNLFIDSAVQKTFIELDNSGTRAAAVTAITIAPECAPAEDIERYRVTLDRPFVYAIIDTQTGLPIFLGICENITDQ